MITKSVPTFEAKIYIGLREGYTDNIFNINDIEGACQDYVDEIGWRITVTKTKFIYKNGFEPGVIIGIINYPRFPLLPTIIVERTITLGIELMKKFRQYRISIVLPNKTIMLESDD